MRGLNVLRERDFRLFFTGYSTSLLGSSMSAVALAFAVLDDGFGASGLGQVLAAVPATQLLFMLIGGAVADRFGPRRIMLAGDAVRCGAQTALAVAILVGGHLGLWVFVVLSAVRGLGEAFFNPGLSALVVRTVQRDRIGDANALLGTSQSIAKVAGPALAGVLVAVTSPGVVVAIDAGTYTCSLLALSLLRPRESWGSLSGTMRRRQSLLRSLADGWSEFTSRRWLVASTLQFTSINLVVWGPFLVLGPALAHQHASGASGASGAREWGVVMGGYGAGSILGGLLALGRRPSRPLVVATVATVGYAVPCVLFALQAPTAVIAGGACVAGIGSTVSAALSDTATQLLTPVGVLARVRTFQTFGAFSLGPLALVLAGPIASHVGARAVLAFGAAWTVACVATVLALPSIRAVRWPSEASETSEASAHQYPCSTGPRRSCCR